MTTQALLDEIKRLSRGKISEETLDEVRAHLDAAIQARLELGSSLADAEIASVAAFGDPKDFVRELVGDQRRDNVIDPGVGISLVLWLLCTAILMGWIAPLKNLAAGVTLASVLIGVLCWRSFLARRLQWPLFLIAFLVGIPIYGYTLNNVHLDLGLGADASASLFGILGLFSFLSWLLGSLARGQLQKEIRSLAIERKALSFKWWHLAVLIMFASLDIASAVYQAATHMGPDLQPRCVIAYVLSLTAFIVLGFRSGMYSIKKYLLAALLSLVAGAVTLAIPLIMIDGDFMEKAMLDQMIRVEEPNRWMHDREQSVEQAVSTQRQNLLQQGPPYRLRTSANGLDGDITSTVNNWGEADRLLLRYRQRELAKIQHDLPFMQRIRENDIQLRDTPWTLNILHTIYASLRWWIGVWIILIAAQGMAAVARDLLSRVKPQRRGLA